MDQREASEHLAVIRRIMETAAQYTVLPGWSAIVGGILALAGCAVSYVLVDGLDLAAADKLAPARRAGLVAVWVAVAVAAVVVDVILTFRAAARRGLKPWSRLARMAAYAVGPSVVIGCALTVYLVGEGRFGPLPGIWMMLYGAGVWTAGVLSIRAPRLLGAAFLVTGVVTLFALSGVALALVAVSFGGYHVAFGIYLIRRFGE